VVKLKRKTKGLTFGDFIAAAYRASGKKARGIVHLAVNTRLVQFCGKQRFVIN